VQKRNLGIIAAVTGILVLGGLTTANAAATITGQDIVNGTIESRDIKNGTIGLHDIGPVTQKLLKESPTPVYEVTDPVNVANIGGTFKTRATLAGTVELPAGKYVLTADGFFRSNSVTSGETTLQTAVRVGWNGTDTFGTDLGTAFTGGSPTAANREVSTSSTRVVTFTETTTVQLLVFGYDNSGGSADSGKFDAQVFLTAEPVKN
jgi:hypothetical protein